MTVKLNTGKPVARLDHLDRRQKPDVKDKKSGIETRQTDQVKISAFAREAGQARESGPIRDSRRADRIAALKEQIADGSYQPDSRAVATSLLKHILKDR